MIGFVCLVLQTFCRCHEVCRPCFHCHLILYVSGFYLKLPVWDSLNSDCPQRLSMPEILNTFQHVGCWAHVHLLWMLLVLWNHMVKWQKYITLSPGGAWRFLQLAGDTTTLDALEGQRQVIGGQVQ